MTKRDLEKLKPGDRLLIKKGYTGYGKEAIYINRHYRLPHLQVLMPGQSEPTMHHQTMFSVRTPAQEVTRESVS